MLQTVYLIVSSKFALDFSLGFLFFKKYLKILKITGKILKIGGKILNFGPKILIKRGKILFFDITPFCSCCKSLSNNSQSDSQNSAFSANNYKQLLNNKINNSINNLLVGYKPSDLYSQLHRNIVYKRNCWVKNYIIYSLYYSTI